MRNQLIILSLFLIPVFSCQDNNVIKPDKSVTPSQSSSMISVTPSMSVNPTVSPSLSPIPSPIVSMSPQMVDQAKIDYPDDYNQEEIIDKSVTLMFDRDSNIIRHENGVVYDRNNNPVPDTDITIKSMDKYGFENKPNYFYLKTKTDNRGSYKFDTYEGLPLNIIASKLGFTTRKIHITPNYLREQGGTYDYNFGGVFGRVITFNVDKSLSINNEPEITSIIINKQRLIKYNIDKIRKINKDSSNVYKRDWDNVVTPNVEVSRFKIKSTEKLEIEINFNKSIVKNSLENNIEVKSFDDIDIYDKSTKNIIFNWSENDSKLYLEIPIRTYNIDKKYRLGFKNPFTDTEGHQAYSYMYTSLINLYSEFDNELSENIVFSIAGNK